MDAMDEDVSARVLLKGVLHTELPKTPITRSISRSLQQASMVTQSTRTRQSISGMPSPHVVLRKIMKDRLRESVSRPPAQQTKAATLNRKGVLSGPASRLSINDDVTPRGLLRGILHTETESSPLVPNAPVRAAVGSAESSLYSNRPSTGTLDLDLPDLSTVNLTMAVRGISRKRPQRNIDLSMFERGLEQGADGIEGPKCKVAHDQSSLSNESDGSSVLSLKTPHADPQTVRRGLRRAVKRRAVDVDDFEQGVESRLTRKQKADLEHSVASAPGMLSEARGLEKFTLGITDLSVSDTSDIIMSSTALYPHPVSMPTADACTVADKDTVTATQIQRNVEGGCGPPGEGVQGENRGSLWRMDGGVEEEPKDSRVAGEEDAEAVRSCEGDMEEEGLMREEDLGGNAGVGVEDAEVRKEEALQDGGEDGVAEREGLDGSHRETWGSEEEEEGVPNKGRTWDGERAESEREGLDGSHRETWGSEEEGVPNKGRTWDGERAESEREGLDGSHRERSDSEQEEDGEPGNGKMAESEGKEAASLDSSQGDEEQQVLVPAHVARQRAYRSEGGAKLPEAAMRGRDFRSLGAPVRQADTESDGTVETAGPSVGWHSRPEEASRSQTSEGSPPAHSPHTEEPHSRRSSWKPEQSTVGTAAVTPGCSDWGRCNVQDKGNLIQQLESSQQLESPEAEMSPLAIALSEDGADDNDLGDEDGENEQQSREESEEDGSQSEELSMKTPAFVRQKKTTQTPGPAATPGLLKLVQNAKKPSQAPATQPKRKRQAAATKKETGLPKSYLMSVFKHFAKTKVSSDVYPVLKEVVDKFFNRLSEDLEVYARHAKRKTIELEDVELLLRRQGFVTDSMPLNVLIERYLPQEYRRLLIPVATSGNKVVPKPRR